MKILSVAGCPYEDYDGQILHLHVELGEREVIRLNETISIEMMDGSFLEREVRLINPKYAGDFYVISSKAKTMVEKGEYGTSDTPTEMVMGPSTADIVVTDVPYHEVKTDEEIAARKAIEEMRKMICLSPFKELYSGDKSIHDFVKEGYSVPDKVIAYLRITEPYLMSPGVYDHPFKPGTRLLGPYLYTDWKHYWDRDLWKYVVKYHVTLPDEFVDYVMSGAGDKFIEEFIDRYESWSETIKKWKKQKGMLCLLPDDAGDKELSDF